MITLFTIILAASMNAVMDTLAFHRSVSIWKASGEFWTVDKGGFLPFTKYRFNAWHLAKSIMIMAMVVGALVYEPIITPVVDFVILGIVWNIFFNILFNKILEKV